MSKKFVIDKQNSKILDLLEHDELSVLIKAICGYINNDEFDIISPKIEAIYNVLKIQMDNDIEPTKIEVDKTVRKKKVKTENIPSFEEVYLYLQFIPEYKNKAELLKFSLKAKYDSWIENKWRDGYNKEIKNWKIKIRQILPHLKEIHNGSTKIEQKQISISDSRRSYTEKVLGINGNENKNEGVSSFEETDYTDVSLF
jgi:hypothetical protein